MEYYQHSGRFSPPGLAIAAALSCLGAFVLAFIYAYLVLYIPLAGYVSFILTGGFGALVGVTSALALRHFNVRNRPISAAAAFLVATFALYAAWAVWIFALLKRSDVKDVGLFDVLLHPTGLWHTILLVNKNGAWSFKGSTPTGWELWILWGIEAAIVLGLPPFLAWTMLDDPFCETCTKWCAEKKGVAFVAAGTGKDSMRDKMEAKDFAYLKSLGAPAGPEGCRVDLHSCDQCNETNTLTVVNVKVNVDKEGKTSTTETTWVPKLLITQHEAELVRGLAKLLSQAVPEATPPKPADAPPPAAS